MGCRDFERPPSVSRITRRLIRLTNFEANRVIAGMFFRKLGRSVRGSLPAFVAGLMLSISVASAADLSQAVVRQKVNVVTIASNLSAEARPASTGSLVRDENVV